MARRINLFSGPGSGKTSTAAWLFAELKIKGHDIHFIDEQAKKWAYQKRSIISFDQMFLTASQITAEDELLRAGVKYIIADSPCWVGYFYALRDKLAYAQLLLEMGRHIEKLYPSINILLTRDVPYQTKGRYETEEEAKYIDELMSQILPKECQDLIIASPRNKEVLLERLDKELHDGNIGI